MGKQVFISHSSDDRELAQALVKALEEFGVECWIAPRDIPAGKDWDVSIINAIENCSGAIFLISNNSNQSEQAKREVQIAVEANKWLIPICIDGVEPSKQFKYYLTSKQWFYLNNPPEQQQIKELLNEINSEIDKNINVGQRKLTENTNKLNERLEEKETNNGLIKDDTQNNQIDLIPKFADSGTESMFQFFTGEVDVAYMGLTPYVLGVVYGLPIKIVAVAQELHKSHGIVMKQSSILESDENVKIGTVFGSSGHYLAHKWMELEDLNVSFVNLSTIEQKEAFEYGFLDGVAVWEPHVSLLEKMGGQCVFDTSDLDTPIFNIIAASKSTIENKREEINRFLDTHFSAIDIIEKDNSKEYEDYFQVIYNREISPQEYGKITTEKYKWPKNNYLTETNETEDIKKALENSVTFLSDFGLISDNNIDPERCFPQSDYKQSERRVSRENNRDIKLGYSDSLLCSTFHISQRLGLFEDVGIKIRSDETRLVEKIASFDKQYREKISEIRDLAKNNFEAATVVLGKENKKLFSSIYERIFGKQSPDDFKQLLDELDEEDLLPGHVLTSAHWIRQLQKIAADQEGITSSQANDALTRFVDILEWFHDERDNLSKIDERCPDCGYEIEDSSWKVCPDCGMELSNTCIECGAEIELVWDHCPECGTNL